MQKYKTIEEFFQAVIDDKTTDRNYATFDMLYLCKDRLLKIEVIREKNINTDLHAFLTKSKQSVIRLNTLLSLFEDSLKRAYKESHYTTRTTHPHNDGWYSFSFFFRFEKLPFYKNDKVKIKKDDKERIYDCIFDAGEKGATQTDIVKVKTSLSFEERNGILQSLIDSKMIICTEVKNEKAQKPTKKYFKFDDRKDSILPRDVEISE